MQILKMKMEQKALVPKLKTPRKAKPFKDKTILYGQEAQKIAERISVRSRWRIEAVVLIVHTAKCAECRTEYTMPASNLFVRRRHLTYGVVDECPAPDGLLPPHLPRYTRTVPIDNFIACPACYSGEGDSSQGRLFDPVASFPTWQPEDYPKQPVLLVKREVKPAKHYMTDGDL